LTTDIRSSNSVQTEPLPTETPQLEERLWKAWIEKNEKRDKVKFARRLRTAALLAALTGLSFLALRLL